MRLFGARGAVGVCKPVADHVIDGDSTKPVALFSPTDTDRQSWVMKARCASLEREKSCRGERQRGGEVKNIRDRKTEICRILDRSGLVHLPEFLVLSTLTSTAESIDEIRSRNIPSTEMASRVAGKLLAIS